jgi:hypothetical protein
VQSINESLQSIDELPVRLRIGETNSTKTEAAKIESAVRKTTFGIPSDK